LSAATVSEDDRDIDPKRDLEGDWYQDEFLCTVAGIDEYGYWHIYDDERRKVVVLDEDGINFEHCFDSAEGPSRWGEWADHVEAKRGWDEMWMPDLMYHMQDTFSGIGGDPR
jgi:hypothetical protein